MSPKTIRQIKHPPSKDILANASVNATQLDAAVGRSIAACSEALKKIKEPQRFSDLDLFHLQSFVEGMRCSHASVRILIDHGSDGATVDAMAIARLQIESVYTWCYLLEDPAHIRLYLKDAWKKQYVRFLLAREEWERLGRARAYYQEIGPDQIERLRAHASVSEEEKKWIDFEQLGGSAAPKKAEIPFFPTPNTVIHKMKNDQQRSMLERLYPEYQYFSCFAHGGAAASILKTMLNSRSGAQCVIGEDDRRDMERRQIAAPSIFYSALCAVQVATEAIAVCSADVNLRATVSDAWTLLSSSSLLARTLWELRSKALLGVIGSFEDHNHA